MIKRNSLQGLQKGDKIKIEYSGVTRAKVISNNLEKEVLLLSVGLFGCWGKHIKHYSDYNLRHFELLNN